MWCIQMGVNRCFGLAMFAMMALSQVAIAGWGADPLSWKSVEGGFRSRGNGFALSDESDSRVVSVTARVRPETCDNEEWATLGIGVFADSHNFWHLSLVKQPRKMGEGHCFELAMMLNDAWPVQNRLKCLESHTSGEWKYGCEYDLSLEMGCGRIKGAIVEVSSGQCVYRMMYALDGLASNHGVPALHVTNGLEGYVTKVGTTTSEAIANQRWDDIPYPTNSASKSVAKPTGFFTVMERGGRWMAIDPNGAPFTVLGVDHVQPWGMFCESFGYSPYGKHVKESYKDLTIWADETLARLKSWGFNALGAGCDVARLSHRGLIHTIFLNMGDRLCYEDPEWYICKCLRAPCTAFPNVFHPDFMLACEYQARRKCSEARTDPWLFGYFIDNELAWWGRGKLDDGLFNAVQSKPDSHSAKKALVKFVAGRPITPELKREFLSMVAERYFATTVAAIRKYDKDHMILGCRFAGMGGAHELVWKVAAKYCDVVTFNQYPWADLDRNVVFDRKGGTPIKEKFDAFYKKVERPMLLTEWSFPALDTGRPCYCGAGQRFATQDLRVKATELFARTLLNLPYFIGYDYFMWVDQPAPGMNSFFGEDSNYGLVTENGTPHQGITAMFSHLQSDIDKVRKDGFPKECDYTEPPAISEIERFVSAAKGEAALVRFAISGSEWVVSNDVGLVLKGSVASGKTMVSSVSLDGKVYGSLGGLAELEDDTGHSWIDARDVKDVRFERNGACGAIVVMAEGTRFERKFEITLRCTMAPGRKDFVAEIVALRNVGMVELNVPQLYLRPFAAERPSKEVRSVPNLWKGKAKSHWQLKDGAQYGVQSGDPDLSQIRLWLSAEGGQHPDVAFTPAKPLRLVPGETYRVPRPMSALVFMK